MKNISLVLVLMGLGFSNMTFAQGDVFLSGYSVNCLVRVNDDVILAGTDKGLWRYTDGQWAVVPNLSTYIINDIAVGANKNVWIATNGRKISGANTTYSANGGVFLLETPLSNDTISWGSIDGSLGGLTSRNVTGIEVDVAQNVWTSHSYHNKSATSAVRINGGLSYRKFNTNYTPLSTRTAFEQKNGALPDTTACFPRLMETVGKDGDTSVWTSVRKFFTTTPCGVDTTNVLYRFDKNGNTNGFIDYTFFSVGSSIRTLLKSKNAFVRAIYTDKSKNTWFGFSNLTLGDTSRGILIRKFDGTWIHMRRLLLPTDASIMRNAIWENKDSSVSIGTDKGLLVFKITNNDFVNPTFYSVYDMSNTSLVSNRILSGFYSAIDTATYVGTEVGGFKVSQKPIVFSHIKNIGLDEGQTKFVYNPIVNADLTITGNDNSVSKGKSDINGRILFSGIDASQINNTVVYTIKVEYGNYSISFKYPTDCANRECDTILMPIDLTTQLKKINASLLSITLKTPESFKDTSSQIIEGYTTAKMISDRWLQPYSVSSLAINKRKIDTLASLMPVLNVMSRNLVVYNKVNKHAILLSYDIVEWFLDCVVLDGYTSDYIKKLLDPRLNPIKDVMKKMGEKLNWKYTFQHFFSDGDQLSFNKVEFSMSKFITEALGKIGKEVDKKIDLQIPLGTGIGGIPLIMTSHREWSQDMLKSLVNSQMAEKGFMGCNDNISACDGTNSSFYQAINMNNNLFVNKEDVLRLIRKEDALMDIFELNNKDALAYMDETRNVGKDIKNITKVTDVIDKAVNVTYFIPTPAVFLTRALQFAAKALKLLGPIAAYSFSASKTYDEYIIVKNNPFVTNKKIYNLRGNNPADTVLFNGITSDSIDIIVSNYNTVLDKVKDNFLLNAPIDSICKNLINLSDKQDYLDSILAVIALKLRLVNKASRVLSDSAFDDKYNRIFSFPKNNRIGIFLLSAAKLIIKDSVDNATLIDYYNTVKASNSNISAGIDNLSNVFNGQSYPALLISNYSTMPRIVRPNTSSNVRIYFRNIGGVKAKNAHISINIKPPFRVSRDSIFIGDVEANESGFVDLLVTAPNLFDTTSIFSFSFNSTNSYVTQKQYVISTEKMPTGVTYFGKDELNYFTISPNPTTAKITLKQTNTFAEGPLSINVSNGVGQVVWQQTVSNLDGYVIDLGDKPNGLYIIKVSQQDGRFQTEKVVIQH